MPETAQNLQDLAIPSTDIPDYGGSYVDVTGLTTDASNAGFAFATNVAQQASSVIESISSALAAIAASRSESTATQPTVIENVATPEPVLMSGGGGSLQSEISLPPTPVFSLYTFPDLPAPPSMAIDLPDVNLSIPVPSPLSATAPTDPGSLVDVVVPDAPTVLLPEVPSLAAVSIPDIPTLDLPTFEAMLRDAPLAPDTSFSFSEAAYTSSLLEAYKDVILSWVQGASTGIAPDVEEAIWNRARDREAAQYGPALTQVARDFAARGFPLPPGAAVALAHQATQKSREASSTVNRDIAIKQAELEQATRQFALDQARQVEMGLMSYASTAAQRAFEGAKYVVEAGVAVYGAQVQQYNADVQAFVARAGVYRDRIQGELAKLEVYKSQIEGQRLVAMLNEQAVAVYTARLEGIKTMISVYEQQVAAARTQAEVQRTQVEAFKARVEAYGETVRAKAAEYDAYATRVKAEISKYELPKAQTEILRGLADAYAAQVSGVVSAESLRVKVGHEIPLERYKAEVDGTAKMAQAAAAELQAEAAMFDAEVRERAVQVDERVRTFLGQVELQKAKSQEAVGRYQVDTQKEIGEMQNSTDQSRIASAAAIAAGQQAAQLAAAAMAMHNFSTSVNSSTTSSVSQSTAHSLATSIAASVSRNIMVSG